MQLKEYVEKLGQVLELEGGVPKEDEGVWRLWLSLDCSIVLTETRKGYHLYCQLGETGERNREELFSILMANNFYKDNTGEAVLGLDDTGTRATLSLSREEGVEDYATFESDIEDFINFAEFWKKLIEDFRKQSKGAYL